MLGATPSAAPMPRYSTNDRSFKLNEHDFSGNARLTGTAELCDYAKRSDNMCEVGMYTLSIVWSVSYCIWPVLWATV